MLFALYPLRFSFTALDSLYFPPGKSSNILRGAFGAIFRRIACLPQCDDARTCEWKATCPYARLFAPSATGGPSGLADSPRPFVFRATHLDGRHIPPGANFHFDLNLFDASGSTIPYLVLAFAQFAREGLGPGSGRVKLQLVSQLDAGGAPRALLYGVGSLPPREDTQPLELSLDPPRERIARLRLRFLTPTELKDEQHIAARPEFPIVAARARDRISTLHGLYGPGPLAIDFPAFRERAALVRMTRCDTQRVDLVRRSSRTGQTHSIGGFIGEAEYEGDLTEFVPYLHAAQWTGIGRQTVWGKGQIVLE